MTSLFPPFNRRSSFRKQPYFYEAGRGVNYKSTGGPFPTLDLNFLSGTLDPRITFSRASNATLTDSTGKITYAPNNLFIYSEQFNDATWLKVRASVSANTTVSPNGTTTADTVIEDTSSGTHYARQATTTSAAPHVISVYTKAKERTWSHIRVASLTNVGAYFDLTNGVVGTVFANCTASISSVGNGWYRCSVFFTSTAASQNFEVMPASADNTASYIGDGTSGIFVWGAQLELVTYQTTPSTYNATTTAVYYGPRFDYDPVTLAAKGLLIEEARTNLLTYSQALSNAAWTKTDTTVTDNQIVSPSGVVDASKVLSTSAVSYGNIFTSTSATVVAGGVYTVSVYLKFGVGTAVRLRVSDGVTGQILAQINPSTGVISVNTSGPYTNVSVSSQNVGNGWYRYTVTATQPAGQTSMLTGLYIQNTNDYVYAWGFQIEAGAFATSYIPTVASSVARSADIATMTGTNFSSWFNQGPVNLLLYSEQFDNAYWDVKLNSSITANATTAPNSTLTADKLVENTATGQHWVGASSPAITITSGVAYTISVYAKQSERGYFQLQGDAGAGRLTTGAVFNLTNGTVFSTAAGATASITDAGNGWYRCAVTATASGTGTAYPYIGLRQNSAPASGSYLGDGTSGLFIWGAQFEVGSTATTYIPTTTVPVANPPAVGTVVASYDRIGIKQFSRIFMIGTAAENNQISALNYTAGQENGYIVAGASSVVISGASIPAVNTVAKFGFAFSNGDSATVLNGGTPSTSSFAFSQGDTGLYIGHAPASSQQLNGHIQYIKYYNQRLPNAKLQALTV